jgi:hypothetical protein
MQSLCIEFDALKGQLIFKICSFFTNPPFRMGDVCYRFLVQAVFVWQLFRSAIAWHVMQFIHCGFLHEEVTSFLISQSTEFVGFVARLITSKQRLVLEFQCTIT